MKTIDLATLDLVSGGIDPGVCNLVNLSGHPVTVHAEGQRIAMAPGSSQGLVDGEPFSVSSRGRSTYSGRCSGSTPLGIAKNNFPYQRHD